MKILHITSYYPPHIGGVEMVAKDVVDALRGCAEQVVLCFNHEKGYSEESDNGVKIIRTKCIAKISSQAISLQFKKVLKRVLAEYKPDYIHFHYPNPLASHYLMKTKFDAKLIVYWHSDIIKQKFLKKFFVGETKRMLEKAYKIVATSPLYIDKSDFLPFFKDKITVVPNAINEKRLVVTEENIKEAQRIREEYSGCVLGFNLGRHVPYKGLKYLIEASGKIDSNVRILLAGTGPLTEKLKKQAAGDEKIVFLGLIPIQKIVSYFLACDMILFPSITKNEAFGIALAEGMYFSKPAVTFTIEGSGVNFVSVDGVTGIECPSFDTDAYAEAVNKLAADKQLRDAYGVKARERVIENFTSAQFRNNIRKLYGIDGEEN